MYAHIQKYFVYTGIFVIFLFLLYRKDKNFSCTSSVSWLSLNWPDDNFFSFLLWTESPIRR